MHWIVAMLSIVATETSVLTFVGIPAMSYASKNWNFLQVVFGYILGRTLVSYLFLPMYYKEGIVSIYQVIGDRFGEAIQKIADAVDEMEYGIDDLNRIIDIIKLNY